MSGIIVPRSWVNDSFENDLMWTVLFWKNGIYDTKIAEFKQTKMYKLINS